MRHAASPSAAGGERAAGRIAAALLVAAVIAVVAFLFRFNTLGGTLGGFDNDHYVHLVRSDLLLHGEQPLRDFADAELRGAWPSLGYAASAWAQQLWGRTLLAEAFLTAGGLALAAAGVFLLSHHLSQRWFVSLLAAAAVIVSFPKLYNYEKVIVLLVAAAIVRRWIVVPSWPWLAALAAWTVIAGLIRHDYGVYVAAAAVTALLVRGPAPATARLGRVAAYAVMAAVLLLPSIAWVQTHVGVVTYVQRSIDSVRGESSRTELTRPAFDINDGASEDNLIAAAYYIFWVVPSVAVVALLLLWWRQALDPVTMTTGAALVACAVLVNLFFLRGNLLARFGDAIVPVALLAAWTAGAAAVLRHSTPGRPSFAHAGLWLSARAPALILIAALFAAGEIGAELRAGGFTESADRAGQRFRNAYVELSRMPPASWHGVTEQGTLRAAQYLAECTEPADRVLVATYAPEVPVYARRLIAAGQGTFGLTFYETEAQQREAIARLQQQSVPVVIGSADDFEGEFAGDYRLVAAWVAARYRDAGTISVDGEPRFRVLVETARPVRGTHPVFQLPCFK
jgi:hypothetical protein